jgi:RimJ/RimL family protein N-acetyltransferase
MSTLRVRLRPVRDADLQFLYGLMTAPESGARVRFAGATPSPAQVASTLWEDVLAQFIIETVSGQVIGLFVISSPNFRDGFAYFSVLGLPGAIGRGRVAEGGLLGVHYAFSTWPFRKLYMEASETSYGAFESGLGRFFAEEGRLRQHAYFDGRYQDLRILAVYRETWVRLAPRYLKQSRQPKPDAVGLLRGVNES